MLKLKFKLSLFNLLSKLVFTSIFIAVMPFIVERINIIQTDNDLIQKREKTIQLISQIGIEPFIATNSDTEFGSYNILKDEFISLGRFYPEEDWNFIEVTQRQIEDEIINYRVLNYSLKIDDQKYLLEIGKSLESIKFTERHIKKIILFFLVFIISITLLADLYYTNKILHPLDLIIRKLKGTSSPEHFDKTDVKTTTSDFYQLDQTMKDLMDKIEDLFRKEKNITINISHELMTPVSVLRSKLENLLLKENLDPEVADKIEESLKTIHRLKTLVNSLILIARIESQQYLKDESFSINELLSEIRNEILPIAEDSEITLNEQYENDLIFKNANRSLIFSMFYNVVNNAVKNTPAKGSIIIQSHFQEKNFEVIISDTGNGMTSDQIKNLFQRFSSKIHPSGKGTGIGLAITKSIADFHKIEISVNSILNSGTTFSFSFPENS